MRALRSAERLAWGLGVLLLVSYGAARVHGQVMQTRALQAFDDARETVDFSLWSEGRIEAYRNTPADQDNLPLAVLRIPGIDLEVPVFDGTDEATLNRAVGRISGTARPGETGNLGIAGHRDGFFRGLKDVSIGDTIDLQMLTGADRYVISEITITTPSDVAVLDPTEEPSLTLVTCYPFYFVGSAPKRYIVRAVLQTDLSNVKEPQAQPLRRPAAEGRTHP